MLYLYFSCTVLLLIWNFICYDAYLQGPFILLFFLLDSQGSEERHPNGLFGHFPRHHVIWVHTYNNLLTL